MAGVKGKSGGPRKNAGGARPGAGRKPKQQAKAPAKKSANAPSAGKTKKEKPIPVDKRDMLQLLQDVALGKIKRNALQVRAAIAAVQYTHLKKGEAGKKDGKQESAKAAAGRFAPTAPPPTGRPALRSVK